MATHKIGKLKFNISKAGFAFRWNEGEIQRFPFGLQTDTDIDVANGLDGYDDYRPDEEDAYYDDSYKGNYDNYEEDYDDGYDTQDNYVEDSHADRYVDDGYNQDDYADQDYDDQDGYDDPNGYSYDDGGYYDENGEYVEDGYEEASPLMQYIDENDWVTYALLVLFPPLGIYLLWRRGCFDTMIRSVASAASALWFIAIIWLIITLIPKVGEDLTTEGGMNLVTISPPPTQVVTVAPSVTPTIDPMATQGGLDITDPTATPLGPINTNTTGETGTGYVFSPSSGYYYHAIKDCNYIVSGTSVSQVTVEAAERRGQAPCPQCYDETIYYATANGDFYHKTKTCSEMSGSKEYTAKQAQNEGKTACPVCILETQSSLNDTKNTTSDASATSYIKNLSTDKSGVKVWATKNGKNFHTKSNCSSMKGASNITLLAALKNGKTACSTCASVAGRSVYCTIDGKSYHSKSNCSGMSGAKMVTVAQAMVMGKDSCKTCIGTVTAPNSSGSTNQTENQGNSSDGQVYVYGTSNGRSYHTKSNCQGMTGAERVLLKTAIASGRPACSVCCPDADRTVYATVGGKYYHSYATCSDMSGATSGTLAKALANGFKRCDECWSSNSNNSGDSGSGGSGSSGNSASGVTVYATQNGKSYHTVRTCSGMRNASAITLEAAIKAGKPACKTCATIAETIVYATAGGKYYHYKQSCSNMTNATPGTLANALTHGFAACPTCVKGSNGGGSSGGSTGGDENVKQTYTPGTSGIKVYAVKTGKYYHLTKSCAGSEASYVTLETALNYGKTACPSCAKKTAEGTVYAAKGEKYYHTSRAHAGANATSGTRAAASAYGFKACPNCDTASDNPKLPEKVHSYTSGKSGKKVYAKMDGTYFHINKDHAGSGSSHITLETAINYGKRPCPDCSSYALKRVYATNSGKYYHSTKACAGSGSTSGYLAVALASGKAACPVCINGSSGSGGEDGGGDGGDGGDGGSGGTTAPTNVYIDLSGDSNDALFHKSSKCSRAGMKSGSKVTLEFVKDQGFKACSYCW